MRVSSSILKILSVPPSQSFPPHDLATVLRLDRGRYKSVISEAVVEVERLNELRGEKMNRVKLVEREKSALEGRKKEADVYLRDQNELVHNQSALFQVNMHHSNQNSEIYLQSVVRSLPSLVHCGEERRGDADAVVR